jgi:hypothetical protein
MEASGVFGEPVWNVLEGPFQLLFLHPQHYKGLRGKKTDLKDGEPMGELLQHLLRSGSCVPLSVARLNPLASQLGTRARTGFQPDPKTVGSSDGVRRTGLGGPC